MKIVTVAQMVGIEQAADAAGHSYDSMMELAGRSVAAAIRRHMEPWTSTGSVVVLVGPGNNGGDGLVAARYLRQWDDRRPVNVYCWKRTPGDDANYDAVQQLGLPVIHAADDPQFAQLAGLITGADLIVDALLGTGVSRPIGGTLADLLKAVHQHISQHAEQEGQLPADNGLADAPDVRSASRSLQEIADYDFLTRSPRASVKRSQIVAVDCPSGLNCDTGTLDAAALPADLTVTFANPKIGHFVVDGPGACGRLEVADIGTSPDLARDVTVELATPASMQKLLPVRPADAHKGTFGKALVVAGSVPYTGAAHLACAAAYRAGAGLVTAGVVSSIHTILATGLAEATWLLLPEHHGVLGPEAARIVVENLKGYASLLIGPGLTQEDETVRFVHELLGIGQRQQSGIGFVTQQPSQTRVGTQTSALKAVPLVLDADALNALARGDNWHEVLPANTILTPHPGEMARLCRCTTADVRADRIGLARSKAAEWNAVVLLKGAYTVVASPDDHATVLPFANPALATAGSGDVLSGVIVGLLSQGLAAYDAAVLGGYLHGLAGELARIDLGEAGVVAGDLIARLPLAIRQLRAA